MEITKRFVHYLLKPSLRPLPVSCVAASLVTGIDVALLSLPLTAVALPWLAEKKTIKKKNISEELKYLIFFAAVLMSTHNLC